MTILAELAARGVVCMQCVDAANDGAGAFDYPHQQNQHIATAMARCDGGGRFELILDRSVHDVDWRVVPYWEGLEVCVAALRRVGVEVLAMRRTRPAWVPPT